jgi:hypothetical protein
MTQSLQAVLLLLNVHQGNRLDGVSANVRFYFGTAKPYQDPDYAKLLN